jgi:outer membrane protein TolC
VQRAEAAETMVEQARAAWYPVVSLQGSYVRTNSPMTAFGAILNERAFNFGLDFNHPGQIDNLNATGTVAYNLYGGGRPTAGLAAAHSGALASKQDVRAARNQLGAAVAGAYLAIRKAREGVTALESGAKAYEASVAVARARFGAGQMFKADLLSLEVQLAETREQLSAARHGSALAERAFDFLLGAENPSAAVELAEEDPSLARLSVPDTADISLRPELIGLQERIKAAEAMVRAARGGRQPSVNAFASYQYDQGWKLDRQGDSWMAGVSLDLSIFDGGLTSARIRQSSSELAQAKEMLRKASLGIGLEVEQARLAYEDAHGRLSVTAQAVAQAEESAALSRARYEKGLLLTAELIGAEQRLIDARTRRAFATADELTAVADYRRALGLPLLSNP